MLVRYANKINLIITNYIRNCIRDLFIPTFVENQLFEKEVYNKPFTDWKHEG